MQNLLNESTSEKNEKPKLMFRQKIDPYAFFSCCPICGYWDLTATVIGGACLGCTWRFAVIDSV